MTGSHIPLILKRAAFWSFFIFITYKFLAPGIDTGIKIPHLDKLAHFGVFTVLTGLLHFSYKLTAKRQLYIWAIYGAGIEFLQGLTPTRSPEFLDFIADMFGVIAVLLILPKLSSAFARNEKDSD